jgi:hypothetical protein
MLIDRRMVPVIITTDLRAWKLAVVSVHVSVNNTRWLIKHNELDPNP